LKSLQSGGFTFDSSDLAISFDPTKLQISNVRAGSYAALAGFGSSLFVVANPNNKMGTLLISEFTTKQNGVVIPDGMSGDLIVFDVTVLKGFTNGSTVIKLNANIGDHFTDVNGGAATLNPAPNNRRYSPATDDLLKIVNPLGSGSRSFVVSPGSVRGNTGTSNFISRFPNRVEIALIDSRQYSGVGQSDLNGVDRAVQAAHGASPGGNGNKSGYRVNVSLNGGRNASGTMISTIDHGQTEGNIVDAVFADYATFHRVLENTAF
jgi:hypothetical protein